jgi:hypothetical protein
MMNKNKCTHFSMIQHIVVILAQLSGAVFSSKKPEVLSALSVSKPETLFSL